MSKEVRLNNGSSINSDFDLENLKEGNDLRPLDYKEDLAEFGLSDEQAADFLDILFSIMRSFVEMGFKFDVCAYLKGQADSEEDCSMNNKDNASGRE